MLRHDDYASALAPPWLRFAGGHDGHASLSSRYAAGGIYRTIVSKPVLDALSRGIGIEVEGEGEDGDKWIQDEIDRLQVLGHLKRAMEFARLSGGAALLVLTDDNPQLINPLNPEALVRISELRVIEVDDLQVDRWYADQAKATFGQPEIYRIQVAANAGMVSSASFFAHESRIIPVAGDPLPRDARMAARMPWLGGSAVSRAFDAVDRWQSKDETGGEILKRKQQAVYAMRGLFEALNQEGGEARVQKFIGAVDRFRGIFNTITIDGGNKEQGTDTYEIKDLSLGGIPEILTQAQIAVSAECGIPVSILFGRSASGMNATGENDFQGYDDLVKAERIDRAQPAVERLVGLITKQAAIRNKIRGTWRIQWPPLRNLTDQQQADVDLKKSQAKAGRANALGVLIDHGVISGEEARQHLAEGDNEYGIDPNKAIEDPAAERDEIAKLLADAGMNRGSANPSDPAASGSA